MCIARVWSRVSIGVDPLQPRLAPRDACKFTLPIGATEFVT
jgi:hypothetical protein